MSKASAGSVVKVGRRTLKFSNLDKVLYPAAKFTKGDVLDYYGRIAPAMIPHLKDRAITLKRYPNGVDKQFFFEKRCPSHKPDWVKTAHLWSASNKDYLDYCLINDAPSLLWVANLAAIELHTLLSKSKDQNKPTMVVFDLDPGLPATMQDCVRVGLLMRDMLGHLGLQLFPKTSGGKGLHLYIPLNTAVTFDQTKSFAQAVAMKMERDDPKRVISNMSRAARKGKVFIDWSQNDDHKTTACAYTLRAKDRPTASTPLSWDEVEEAHRKKSAKRLSFEAGEVIKRFEKFGDLFSPVLKVKQKLPKLSP